MKLVTGGAGFIGSNLIRKLNQRGIKDIIVVDNLENSSKHLNLNSLEFTDYYDKIDFIKNIDILDSYNIDTIFHIGACSNTMEYDGRYMLKNNYEYSKTLCHYAINKKIKFIYASSASVYGNGDKGFTENKESEYPLNVYAYSKFLFDQYVRAIKENKTQITGLRFFNVFGPQENHKDKMASVIFHFHNQILSDGKIKLFEGSNNFVRDFIFVDDIVDLILHFEDNQISGIFNCGTGEPRSFFDIATIMQSLYDGVKIDYIPFPDKLKGKYQSYTKADLSNLRDKAKYKNNFTSLEEGVKKYVEILKKTNGFYL